MKKLLFLPVILVISLVLVSPVVAAKPKIPLETDGGEYNYENFTSVNGCYYNLNRVWVDLTGVCHWTWTEFEDGSVSQNSIVNGEASIYDYVDGDLVLIEDKIPFYISENFLDIYGDQIRLDTTNGYYQISVGWHELDEYNYQREIDGRFEQEMRSKRNGKWSWWFKAGKCSDRGQTNNY